MELSYRAVPCVRYETSPVSRAVHAAKRLLEMIGEH